jgi:hypothetical protein
MQSSASYDFNTNCQSAMQAILDLRITDARFLIAQEKRLHPENGYVIYLEHYAESVELIITENEGIYNKLLNSYAERTDQMDRLDDGTPDNKWLQAEMLFHTGLAQIKFGTRLSGASKMLGAYRKIRDHRHKYPHFWQNQKLTGIFNIILDFIPPSMRWAADMFGISGNSELGLYQLRHYAELAMATPGFAEEAVMITNLGYKLAWQEEQGLAFIAQQDEHILGNTLVKYLYASTASFTNRSELALQILAGVRREELQVEFYSLDYLTGRCKLNHLEPDASVYLQRYLDRYPGLDYKKDVCNRLSFYYLIQGDQQKFEDYRARIAVVGQEMRDPDQDAVIESKSSLVPHVGLLKARFLCDGGYFEEALEIMKSIDPELLPEPACRIEYHYRLGRIMQLSGFPDKAIPEFIIAYDDGAAFPYTFATRAALQLGKIYEEKKDYAKASLWYTRCAEAYSDTHTTEGVKEMAEKGGKRLKGKF